MGSVYLLTLRQLSGRLRLVIMGVLAALPVLISTMAIRDQRSMSIQDFEQAVLSTMLSGSIIPLVVLAIAAAAFSNELEDRTLANLTLTPIPRWKIVLPKLLASITVAAPFIAVSAFVTSYTAFLGDIEAALAVTGSALLAVVLYSSAFVWLGLVTTQAIGVGLLYIVLWEGFFSGFVSGVRLLSIRHYANMFMHGLDERRFAWQPNIDIAWTITIAVIVIAGFTFFTTRRLRRIDIP